MRRINILFLMLSLNTGGTEKHIFQIITNINRRMFNPVVCCLYDLGSIGKALEEDGQTEIYHNLFRNKWDLSGFWKLINIIRNNKVSMLYTINTPATQFWGTLAVIPTGMKAYFTRVTTTKPLYHGIRRRIINKLMLPFMSAIIAQAKSHKEFLIQNEGLNGKKIKVVFNSIDTEPFSRTFNSSALREEIRIPEDSPVLGIVARLAPEKGHEVLLRASEKIVASFPDIRILIVGEGTEREKLEKLSADLKVNFNVSFLGLRNDIPQLLSLFNVAVLTSNSVVETFSNAVLEYMASSKPVVATDAGSTAEIVIDGETGYVVPCGDSDALADAILKLLNNRKLAKEMGDAGRERVKEKFTVQKMITKYESLFSDMVNNP